MATRVLFIALMAGAVCASSCNNMNQQNNRPIVLGDSSTIVTEKDPKKLQDLVADLKPDIPTAENKDTTPVAQTPTQKAADTAKKTTTAVPVQKQAQPEVSAQGGLTVDFNIASLIIPNVVAKQAGNPDLSHANGAVYTLVSGNLSGNLLKVTANVTKVSQRYQSVVVLKTDMGTLPLETLSTTTAWEALKGTNNNIYKATGLDDKSLEVPEANKNTIRSAVEKAARRHRMSRKKIQEWQEEVHNVRSADQKPLFTTLRSVMWKIDGKDANGKIFSKQIRIDIPL